MKITKNRIKSYLGMFVTLFVIPHLTEYTKDLLYDPVGFSFVLFFFVLSVLITNDLFKNLEKIELEQESERLKNEYRLFKETSHLTPEDFQFRVLQPGEELKGSERPYFKTYINRKVIPYRAESANKTYYTEQSLAGLLAQGNNVLLIGNPTEGKTRTLFEVIKVLNNFLVISLPNDRSLSDKALQLLEDKKVIWIVDNDLMTYQNISLDLKYTFNRLKEITNLCAIAATCRDGPDLIEKFQEVKGQLHEIYSIFDLKLKLERPTNEQKAALKIALNETENRFFPTLGSICMRKHFEFMRIRFDSLTELDKYSLSSIALLFSGYIYPFTLQRIKSVLTNIFRPEQNNIDELQLRASLNNLVNNGFIISPKDVYPIIPEAAYITEPEFEFYYLKDRNLQNDKLALVDCLKEQKDADGLNKLAVSFYFSGDKDTVLKILGLVINEFEGLNDNAFFEQIARALFIKGFTLGQLDRHEEEIQCYDDLVKRFGNSQELVLQQQVAQALLNKGVRFGKLNQSAAAIQCYDGLIECFGNSQELVLQEQVAQALFNKGVRLGKLNQAAAEIQCYDNLHERFGNSQELVLQQKVAQALFNKGVRLDKLNQAAAAIQSYDNLLERFGNSQELVLQQKVAQALVNKGFTLGQLARHEEEIQSYNDLVERFGNSQELVLQEQVAQALVNKGFTLGKLNQAAAEIQCYDNLLERFGNSQELVLQQKVAQALVNKGFTLGQLDRHDEEIQCYDDLVERFGNSQALVLQQKVAQALVNKGITLGQLDIPEGEIQCYDNLLERFGNIQELVLQEEVADALFNKGVKLGKLNQAAAAIQSYDNLLERFGNSQELVLQQKVAQALFNKGVRLGKLNQAAAAIQSYDNLLERFGNSQELVLQQKVAQALFNKGGTIWKFNQSAAAIKCYESIIIRFGKRKESFFQDIVAASHQLIKNYSTNISKTTID